MTEDNDNIPSPDDITIEPDPISPPPAPGSGSDPLIGTKIGSCKLKRVIGSGGMGTVYEAVQENPRRRVALKMMKRGITSRSALRRFEFESQTLARLKHQGVAQVYEAGTHDDGSGGVPYFVMEYISNAKPITNYADDKKLGTKERLDIFSKVCDAVQHGHLKGIVHRDLKPGNILIDSNGQPKVIDFGVARSTDSDMAVTTLQTNVGQLIGTLQYMSPEQCEADTTDIDVRSDVYALGVILYELLTGKPPYDLRKAAIHEAVQIVREEEPTKLSTISRHLRGDIETITLKALEKERDRRYQSATALREDIQHYLSDEPISAKPPGAVEYIRRFAKKYRAAAISIAVVMVVLLFAVVGMTLFAIDEQIQRNIAEKAKEELKQSNDQLKVSIDEANKAKSEAETQREIAEEGTKAANREAYNANIHAAESAVEKNDAAAAHRRLEVARGIAEKLWDSLPFEWLYLSGKSDDSAKVLSVGDNKRVYSVAYNLDGTRLFSTGWSFTTWDPVSGSEIATSFEISTGGKLTATNPEGTRLAVGNRKDGIVQIWDVDTGENLLTLQTDDTTEGVNTIAFSPDGNRIATDGEENTIRIWDANTGKKLTTLRGHSDLVTLVAFSPDGTQLASAADDKTIRIWDVQSGQTTLTLYQETKYNSSFAYSPDGTRLVVGNWLNHISVWDLKTGKEFIRLSGHTDNVESVVYSPDGKHIASSGYDKSIRLWNAETGEEIDVLLGHLKYVRSVTFSPDGTRLASASDDGTVRIWEVETKDVWLSSTDAPVSESDAMFVVNTSPTPYLGGFAISPDGTQIARNSFFSIHLFDVKSGKLVKEIPMQYVGKELLYSSDSSRLFSLGSHIGTNETLISIIDSVTGENLMSLSMENENPGGYVLDGIALSPDDTRLASWIMGKNINIWDTGTGEMLQNIPASEKRMPRMLLFSPDGTLIMSPTGSGDLMTWETETGDEVATIFEHATGVENIVFSSDGTLAATAGRTDRNQITVQIWDALTGENIVSMAGHEDFVGSMEFSPDAIRLVTWSMDQTVRVWDTMSGEELLLFPIDVIGPMEVKFSADGTCLYGSTGTGVFYVWETRSKGRVASERREASQHINEVDIDPAALMKAISNFSSNLVDNAGTSASEVFEQRRTPHLYLESVAETHWNSRFELRQFLDHFLVTVSKEEFSQVADVALRVAIRVCELTNYGEALPLFYLSRIHLMRGEFGEAVTRYREIRISIMDKPLDLNRIAWKIASGDNKEFFNAVSDVSLQAAQRACQLTNYKSGMILDTLARVHFERGELDEAIHWQEEAVRYADSEERGRIMQGYLGVKISDLSDELAEPLQYSSTDGVLINSIFDDSPAANAGLLANDIITYFNGTVISDLVQLQKVIAETDSNTDVTLTVFRKGKPMDVAVTLLATYGDGLAATLARYRALQENTEPAVPTAP